MRWRRLQGYPGPMSWRPSVLSVLPVGSAIASATDSARHGALHDPRGGGIGACPIRLAIHVGPLDRVAKRGFVVLVEGADIVGDGAILPCAGGPEIGEGCEVHPDCPHLLRDIAQPGVAPAARQLP